MNKIGKETTKYLNLINKKLELLKLYQELIFKINLQVEEELDEDNGDEFEYVYIKADEDTLFKKNVIEIVKKIKELEKEIEKEAKK